MDGGCFHRWPDFFAHFQTSRSWSLTPSLTISRPSLRQLTKIKKLLAFMPHYKGIWTEQSLAAVAEGHGQQGDAERPV